MPLLRDSGRYVSVDYLGEDVTDVDDADAAVRVYLDLIDELSRSAIAPMTASDRWRYR